MENENIKKSVLKSFLVIVAISIIFHTYYTIYNASLLNTPNSNISGKSITGEIMNNIGSLDNAEKLVIILEWSALIVVLVIILVKKARANLSISKELGKVKKIEHDIKHIKSKSRTDIDILYDLLKEDKKLKLQLIMKKFGVSKETVMHWFEILEEGNLATIEYPTIGDPELVLKEEVKNKGVKDEKQT